MWLRLKNAAARQLVEKLGFLPSAPPLEPSPPSPSPCFVILAAVAPRFSLPRPFNAPPGTTPPVGIASTEHKAVGLRLYTLLFFFILLLVVVGAVALVPT